MTDTNVPDTDPVAHAAHTAARRLAPDHGPSLVPDVYAALHNRDTEQRPDRYFDPISLGSLIVSVATLAWTIYKDQRATRPSPNKEVIARHVRLQLPPTNDFTTEQRDHIITIVVDDITTNAPAPDENQSSA
jgi:hypothetical protein